MDFSNKEINLQLANYLREERQNHQLDLEDVANKIGVPIQHLKSIESGDFERFDVFYLKMYIKKYAAYLSLNVEELYLKFYGTQIQKEVEVKIQEQKVQKRNRNVGRSIGVACGALVIILGGFYIIDVIKNVTPKESDPIINNPNSAELLEHEEQNSEVIKNPETIVEEPKEEKVVEEEVQTPITTVSLVSQDSKEVVFDILTVKDTVNLKLDFTAACWLSVTLNGQSLIAGETYQSGGTFEQQITSDQFGALEFNVGDATALNIVINDQVVEFEPSTPHQYITINIKTE
ncbi:MAG: DUF4115 domain-containing protein [Turicibacter sp.]|nr:DUF4115 domain-containing protein [Turicibacter sp.]